MSSHIRIERGSRPVIVHDNEKRKCRTCGKEGTAGEFRKRHDCPTCVWKKQKEKKQNPFF